MKAAVFHGADVGLKIEDIPIPKVGADQILVKVAACGVCHSDLHYIEHGVPTFKKPPVVLGHEASGVVEEVGGEVSNITQGQRVLIPAVLTCGKCMFCRTGRENICSDMQMLGNHMDGAYAEYVAVPSKDVLELPASIPLEEASIIADATSTPYHAVKNRARVQPGDTVAVVGSGPVGLFAQMAALTFEPKQVFAIDQMPERLEMARKIGATPIDMSKEDAKAIIRDATDGRGADVVLEAVGIEASLKDCWNYVRPAGTISAVGMYTEPEFPFPMFFSFLRDITFKIGMCPVKRYMGDLMGMIQEGKADPSQIITHRLPMSEAAHGYDIFAKRTDNCVKVLLDPGK